jgi:hypothetical protein
VEAVEALWLHTLITLTLHLAQTDDTYDTSARGRRASNPPHVRASTTPKGHAKVTTSSRPGPSISQSFTARPLTTAIASKNTYASNIEKALAVSSNSSQTYSELGKEEAKAVDEFCAEYQETHGIDDQGFTQLAMSTWEEQHIFWGAVFTVLPFWDKLLIKGYMRQKYSAVSPLNTSSSRKPSSYGHCANQIITSVPNIDYYRANTSNPSASRQPSLTYNTTGSSVHPGSHQPDQLHADDNTVRDVNPSVHSLEGDYRNDDQFPSACHSRSDENATTALDFLYTSNVLAALSSTNNMYSSEYPDSHDINQYNTVYHEQALWGVAESEEHEHNGDVEEYRFTTKENIPYKWTRTSRGVERCQCLADGCKQTFTRSADLSRHHKTRHDVNLQKLSCPKPRCGRVGENGFSRPDHVKEHLREYHKDTSVPKRERRRRRRSRSPEAAPRRADW